MKKAFKKTIGHVKPYVPGKPIDEVKRELGLRRVIKLASNENPYGPSPKVLKSIVRAAKELNRYPDGDCYYLRKTLAKRLGIRPAQLIFGNGSDELIVLCVRALVDPGQEVVIAKPSFLIYEIASKIAGAKVRTAVLKDFHYDLIGMKKAVTKRTKIVFLGNPDNPAGTFIKHREMAKFIKSIRKDILIFIDEAYFEYVTDRAYGDSIKFAKANKNVIVTRTFSKMYGLAGLRIGYGVADEGIVDTLNRIREPFNVNSLAQTAALACLNDRPYYRDVAWKIEKQKHYLYGRLEKIGLKYKDSCTNFILVNVQQDSKKVSKKLLEKGVIVRDMSFWGMKNYIRITIGAPKENQALMKALEEVL